MQQCKNLLPPDIVEANQDTKDLQQATSIAFSMVTQMGFSDTLGKMDLHSEYRHLSSETKQKIEDEVRYILEEARKRATKVLTERRKDLDVVAKGLVEYEVLNADEIRRLLKGEKLPKLTANPNRPIKVPEISLPPKFGGGGPPAGIGKPPSSPPPPSGLGDKIPGLGGSSPAAAGTGASAGAGVEARE